MAQIPPHLDVEAMFQNYLTVTKHDPNKMAFGQMRLTKAAFYAGIGSMLVVLLKCAKQANPMSATEVLSIIHMQHDNFWTKELEDDQAKKN